MATKHEIKVGDNYNGFTIVCVTTATATVVRDGTQEWHIVPLKRVPGWTKTHSKEGRR